MAAPVVLAAVGASATLGGAVIGALVQGALTGRRDRHAVQREEMEQLRTTIARLEQDVAVLKDRPTRRRP